MSSPAGTLWTPNSQTPMAQPGGQVATNDTDGAGVTIRPMRLKVLYTFDDQNKTNCLARWPHVLQIQAVAMDENATIGVIELKTCIQAIVQCSPELVAKLGQDYTVYAYDYSEYDNPLVGQGMLSWALAASSPTPDAPASQSRQLITGRVCKNIQGLFSNGVAETLEVKLRLVPVPTVLQSEYVSSMEKYRELSKAMPAGFDHNEWFTFLQSNPNIGQMANRINTPVPPMSNQRSGVTMEVVNQLLSPSLQPQTSVDPFNNPSQAETTASDSRPPSPKGRGASKPASRPSSRTSVKRPRKPRAPPMTHAPTTHGGNTSGYEEGTDGDEAPTTTKKRAKITKTNWNNKSSFGTGSDSLRVTASTAGSLRLFRPIAIAPATMGGGSSSHLQEMPRAPTPVPHLPPPQHRSRATSQSMLRRNSIASQFSDSQRQYNSPYPPSDGGHDPQDNVRMSIESAMTSPEKEDSPVDTPPNINSSPPVLRTTTSARSSPHIPSSPILPPMPRTDSGFMSGDISELFEDAEDRPVAEEDIPIAAKYSRRRTLKASRPEKVHHGFAIEEVTPGPRELLPTKMLPRAEVKRKAEPKPKAPRRTLSRANSTMSDDGQTLAANRRGIQASHPPPRPESAMAQMPLSMDTEANQPQPEALPSNHEVRMPTPSVAPQVVPQPRPASRSLSRTTSLGALTLPAVAASEPILPPSSLQHAHTWSDAPHPTTDGPTPMNDGTTVEQNSKRSAMGKKNTIRLRLEDAISRGEMPPFCSNCGAIETPAWRKAWAQECKGDPGYHEYSDEAGRVTAIEILDKNDAGKPSAYRLIKKSLGLMDDKTVFAEILLCNPCGIWMSKYKSQRPEDRWGKEGKEQSQPAERKKRAASNKPRKAQAGSCAIPTSEAHFFSDAPGAPENEASNVMPPLETRVFTAVIEQPQPYYTQRGGSVQPMRNPKATMTDAASASLRRAIQSSPARWVGTRNSPIEVEDELGATRRLLFPSPSKDNSPKVLGEVVANFVVSPIDFQSPIRLKAAAAIEAPNKENQPPPFELHDADDDLIKLFEEELTRPSRPTTPVQRTPPANPFKTPTRPTPNHRPITRSISRSAKSVRRGDMMPQRTPSKTPSTTRRSPRHHRVLESPFTAVFNRLFTDNHAEMNSPSRNLELGLDFSGLPDMAHPSGMHSDALMFNEPGFDGRHDFFSTDAPMPSSPPRHFSLYEDPLVMGMQGLESMDQAMWDQFAMDDHSMPGLGSGLVIDANGRATFSMAPINDDTTKIKMEVDEDNQHGEAAQAA